MFYPMLLSLIAVAASAPVSGPEPTIRVTLSSDGQYLPGDRAKVQVIARDDGYLLVFQVNPDGRLRVLFPLDPTDDSYVRGGKRYLLLGRGGREGFTVDAAGGGAVFAAVSLDPWGFTGFVQNDHWDYRALNTMTYDDPEPQLVDLAQGMAGGRFDYDIVGYTVASQVAMSSDNVAVSASVGVIDGCFGCGAVPVGVVYGTGYYNTWGLYDPWYYSSYYNYGPYYPAWAYGPGWGWGWGGGYWGGGYWGGYYPNYPTAIAYAPYTPYQQKQWNRRWSGATVPYRDRWAGNGFTATNTVVGALPGIGVSQRAGFRDRTWSGAAATPGGSVAPSAVPVSKTGYSSSGRRRDVAPVTSAPRPSGTAAPRPSGTAAPSAVPVRPRQGSSVKAALERQFERPEARRSRPSPDRPAVVVAPAPTVGSSPFERRMPIPTERPSQPEAVPVSRTAPAPTATKAASSEPKSSEPVLRRRESEQPSAPSAPAPKPENSGQQNRAPDRGNGGGFSMPPQPSRPPSSSGMSGGSSGGGGGRAAPPFAVAGGGRRR